MLARDTQFGSGDVKRQATASALSDGTDEYSPFWSPPGTRRAASRGANRSESTGVSADGKRAARGRCLAHPFDGHELLCSRLTDGAANLPHGSAFSRGILG
jgi:hypothetical protein